MRTEDSASSESVEFASFCYVFSVVDHTVIERQLHLSVPVGLALAHV